MINKALLEEVLAKACSTGGDFAEVYAEHTRTNSIQLVNGKIDKNKLQEVLSVVYGQNPIKMYESSQDGSFVAYFKYGKNERTNKELK